MRAQQNWLARRGDVWHDPRVSEALSRARRDLEAGRAWKARDRLIGLLAHRQDHEVLDLLAEAHFTAGDLPAAGALWWVTEREDGRSVEAVAAWNDRYGSAEARWRSVPAPVRRTSRSARLRDLGDTARREQAQRDRRRALEARRRADEADPTAWVDRLHDSVVGAVVVLCLLWTVFLAAVGAWTLSQWVLH